MKVEAVVWNESKSVMIDVGFFPVDPVENPAGISVRRFPSMHFRIPIDAQLPCWLTI